MSGMADRLANELDFEQWYVENAFDYESAPLGTRDCMLQRKAWHAAIARLRGEAAQGEQQAVACNRPNVACAWPDCGSDCRHRAALSSTAAPAPVAGEAVAVDDAMVERACRAVAAAGPGEDRHYLVNRETMRAALTAALTQDRASQAGAVPDAVAPTMPLTLRGLIEYGRVAAVRSQGATPDHMRDLIGQMVPHLRELESALAAQPSGGGVPGVIAEVQQEIARAVAKFPTWPTDPLHASGVVMEESGELAKAVLQAVYEPHKSTKADVRAEAIQTAAMAIRFVQSLDAGAYSWAPGAQHDQAAAPAAPETGGENGHG